MKHRGHENNCPPKLQNTVWWALPTALILWAPLNILYAKDVKAYYEREKRRKKWLK